MLDAYKGTKMCVGGQNGLCVVGSPKTGEFSLKIRKKIRESTVKLNRLGI